MGARCRRGVGRSGRRRGGESTQPVLTGALPGLANAYGERGSIRSALFAWRFAAALRVSISILFESRARPLALAGAIWPAVEVIRFQTKAIEPRKEPGDHWVIDGDLVRLRLVDDPPKSGREANRVMTEIEIVPRQEHVFPTQVVRHRLRPVHA